jgi:hypothetical protein
VPLLLVPLLLVPLLLVPLLLVPLLVLRRHPERSEGSLYFAFAFALALALAVSIGTGTALALPLALALPSALASKIKLNFLSYLQPAKKCLFYHHVYHTLDHILTTKTPHSTVRLFPNPLYLRAFRSSAPRAEKPLQFSLKTTPKRSRKSLPANRR